MCLSFIKKPYGQQAKADMTDRYTRTTGQCNIPSRPIMSASHRGNQRHLLSSEIVSHPARYSIDHTSGNLFSSCKYKGKTFPGRKDVPSFWADAKPGHILWIVNLWNNLRPYLETNFHCLAAILQCYRAFLYISTAVVVLSPFVMFSIKDFK